MVFIYRERYEMPVYHQPQNFPRQFNHLSYHNSTIDSRWTAVQFSPFLVDSLSHSVQATLQVWFAIFLWVITLRQSNMSRKIHHLQIFIDGFLSYKPLEIGDFPYCPLFFSVSSHSVQGFSCVFPYDRRSQICQPAHPAGTAGVKVPTVRAT